MKINFNNEGWKNISSEASTFHIHKSVNKTQQLFSRIKQQLENKVSLLEVAKEFNMSAGIVIMYALVVCPNLFESSIKKILRKQMLNNKHISLSKGLRYHIKQDANLLKKLKKYYLEAYDRLVILSVKYQEIQIKLYKILNNKVMSNYSKEYQVGYIKNQKWCSFCLELNSIDNDTIAKEIKGYSLYLADRGFTIDGLLLSLYKHIKEKTNRFNLEASNITQDELIAWFEYIAKKIKLKGAKAAISSFYKYLINQAIINKSPNLSRLKQIQKILSSEIIIEDGEIDSTVPLPEDVYVQIRHHIHELPLEIKNIFLVISSTGCRPSEISSIHSKSLVYNEKLDCHTLSLSIDKQATAYAKKGKKAIRKVPIYDIDTIDAINEQVTISENIRRESKIDSIFVRRNNNRTHQIKYHIPSSKELINNINDLIKKYNICSDIENDIWHYTPYQMRSMIATSMVENGHSSEEVKLFFGWLSTHTSEKAYAYVRSKKIEDLNTKFFKEHFSINFENNLLSSYSRQEKEQMFIELYIHKRQMEYGECVRHPIMGECGKLQSPDSCASCARLITGDKYISAWQKLQDNQKNILDEFIETVEREGCKKNEYETWSEYIIQKNRLESYNSVLKELSITEDSICQY